MSNNLVSWATLSYMRSKTYRDTFRQLEEYQLLFKNARRELKSAYHWPLLPLYDWSRRVEYPFLVSNLEGSRGSLVLDAGSGVTFLPIFLTKEMGFTVECMDIDPSYPLLMRKVCKSLGLDFEIKYYINDIAKQTSIEKGYFDTVYSISVIEHLSDQDRLPAIRELWRIVKPNGRLIITFDVSLTGEAEGIPLEKLDQFLSGIEIIVGKLPHTIKPLPKDILTPSHPGFGLAPIRVNKVIYKAGIFGLIPILKRVKVPLKPIGCLMLFLDKSS